MKQKPTYYLILEEEGKIGIGECSPLSGLSIDDRPDYEDQLDTVVNNPEIDLMAFPSIRFGLEMAKLDHANGGQRMIYESAFSQGRDGIPINGLIWMGAPDFMKSQINDLLKRGFTCLKMKIGAINFQDELEILARIRKEYPASDLILRVDANGAFSPAEALEKLKRLSELSLHSIEQPIKAGQEAEMARLCEVSPLDIALDEELIPVLNLVDKKKLLETIKPPYIILKPSLVGGFESSDEWISEAEKLGIDWWATSALESNIGLNAISQWTYIKNPNGHQGLGTGSLYTNNIDSPLEIQGEHIHYNPNRQWQLDELL
ncbi:o-succinylbenzoate synthase [Portibacter lacus]|uniref:o-succinylbenzoate synthase n=1 Tax=Portibacter lacus TaxID=1099794 RepID=UPI001F3D4473|nr:o-succinylbenzoate synthase [Portibacter lacus]